MFRFQTQEGKSKQYQAHLDNVKNYLYYVSNIKNKQERNSDTILTRMSEHEQANKRNKELDDSRDNAENNQMFLQKMNIPSDLNYIQPR